ncbi:MAG: spore coat U domain-containing protein [Pseudomonadota bacterium]
MGADGRRQHRWAYGRLASAAAVLALAAWPALAGTLGGTMQAQMQLTAGCMVAGSSGASAGVNFGTLDFGTRPGSFTGIVTATPAGGEGASGPTQLVCSPEVLGISIQVGPGAYAGQGAGIGSGSRAMRNGSTAAYIPYELYRDAGYTQPYPAGTAITGINVPANGAAFSLPIHGQINKSTPAALPAGMYTDTLQVTVTY